MTAESCHPDYQPIDVSPAKVDVIVALLRNLCEGPAEAMATLHRVIGKIDELNSTGPMSARQLGEELTMGLLLSGIRDI